MQNQASGQSGQMTLIISLVGAVLVAAVWYAISMSVATALVFGLPIGGIGSLIVYRTIVQVLQEKSPLPPAPAVRTPANGVQPEDANAKTPLKLK